MCTKKVCVSGGFDPLHVGHVRMIQEASKLGDLFVIINNDNWLMSKKGYVFMPENERKEIVEAIKGVKGVLTTNHAVNDPDRSVCRELKEIKPDIFCNGGDRTDKNTPEKELCERLGIEQVYNVGGGKVQSSSDLVKRRDNHR
jgi:cytidyltransferase-like protein